MMRSEVSYQDVCDLAYVHSFTKLSYAKDPLQFGEFWQPNSNSNVSPPVVILIHGGCWLSEYDITHIRPAASKLASAGFAVWAIEYRRLGDEGGGWPGTFEDIAKAVDFIAELAVKFPIDIKRVTIAGHSAGGHLGLWAASRSGFAKNHYLYNPTAFLPASVIALAGITDLNIYSKGTGDCNQSVVPLLGGDEKNVPERYEWGNPGPIDLSRCEVRLLVGEKDEIVPHEQALSYANKLENKIAIQRVEGAGHFDFIHPDTKAWATFVAELTSLPDVD